MIFITREENLQIDLSLQSMYFYTSWMPYHKKYLVMIDKIEEKYQIPFYAIDVDQFSNQCKRFFIDSVPTLLVLREGREVKRICGCVLTGILKDVFADICIS